MTTFDGVFGHSWRFRNQKVQNTTNRSTMSSGVAQLQRHFGGQVDADVLQAILEMHNNDVRAAQAFLEGEGNGPA